MIISAEAQSTATGDEASSVLCTFSPPEFRIYVGHIPLEATPSEFTRYVRMFNLTGLVRVDYKVGRGFAFLVRSQTHFYAQR